MNHSWMSAIIRRLNSVEKMQVFWPWSSLRMSACTVPRTVAQDAGPDLGGLLGGRLAALSAREASSCWSIAVLRKNGQHRSAPAR